MYGLDGKNSLQATDTRSISIGTGHNSFFNTLRAGLRIYCV